MAVSKYCRVDVVQRHMADPHKLCGTKEFLCLSLSCMLCRSGDEGSLWASGLASVWNERRFPDLWMFFLFREKAAPKEQWPPGGPFHSHWLACLECMHTPGHTSGSSSEAQLKVSSTQTWGGACTLLAKIVAMGWSWLYSSRVRPSLEPASFLSRLHILMVTGTTALSQTPCSFCNLVTDTCAPESSLSTQCPQQGLELMVGSSPLPSASPPAIFWLVQGRRAKQGKGLKDMLFRAHWSDLLAQTVVHMLKMQEKEMGQCLERTSYLTIPVPETEAEKFWWCSYCSKPRAFPF